MVTTMVVWIQSTKKWASGFRQLINSSLDGENNTSFNIGKGFSVKVEEVFKRRYQLAVVITILDLNSL